MIDHQAEIDTQRSRQQCQAIVSELFQGLASLDVDWVRQYSPKASCSVLSLCTVECCEMPYTPEQIHLAATSDPTEMVVMWTTLEPTNSSRVQYGLQPSTYTFETNGTTTVCAMTHLMSLMQRMRMRMRNADDSDDDDGRVGSMIDRVGLRSISIDLQGEWLAWSATHCDAHQPDSQHDGTVYADRELALSNDSLTRVRRTRTCAIEQYYYRVGDPQPSWGWNKNDYMWFTTRPSSDQDADRVYTYAAIGDMGSDDASDNTIYQLTHLVKVGSSDIAGELGLDSSTDRSSPLCRRDKWT